MRFCRHQLRVTSSQTVFICNLYTQILLLLWPQGTAYSQILLYVSTRCFNQCDIDIINNLSTRWLPMCLNWHLFGLSLQHTRRFDTTNAQEGNLDWMQSGMPHILLQDCMLIHWIFSSCGKGIAAECLFSNSGLLKVSSPQFLASHVKSTSQTTRIWTHQEYCTICC